MKLSDHLANAGYTNQNKWKYSQGISCLSLLSQRFDFIKKIKARKYLLERKDQVEPAIQTLACDWLYQPKIAFLAKFKQTHKAQPIWGGGVVISVWKHESAGMNARGIMELTVKFYWHQIDCLNFHSADWIIHPPWNHSGRNNWWNHPSSFLIWQHHSDCLCMKIHFRRSTLFQKKKGKKRIYE